MGYVCLIDFNPLSPSCDQYQNLPSDISAQFRTQVLRIKGMITNMNSFDI